MLCVNARPGTLVFFEAELAVVKNGRVLQLRGMNLTGFGEVSGFGNKSARV